MIKPKLLALCGGFLTLVMLTPTWSSEDLRQREASWLKEFKSSGDPQALMYVAIAREEQGNWDNATAAWQLLKKLRGSQRRPKSSAAPSATWNEIADFHLHRLNRKRNLKAHPPNLDSILRRRLADAITQFGDGATSTRLDFLVQADLDGDSIDEIIFLGPNSSTPKKTMGIEKTMGIARWNGNSYQVIWRTSSLIPFMLHVVDEDGDGWKEVFCGYTPDSDDAAKLYFNGKTVLFI